MDGARPRANAGAGRNAGDGSVADPGWPRVFKKGAQQLTVHQPQVDSWHDYTNLHFRSAIAVKGVLKEEKFGVALVKPVLIQKAKDTGNLTVQPLPGQRARLTFADYLKPGDSFALELDLASNRPVGAKIATYLDSREDAVTLDVRFSTLDNNATYSANVTLAAPSKNLIVTVENSDYRRQ